MRVKLVAVLATILLTLGAIGAASPAPSEADTVSGSTSYAICSYYLDGFEQQLGDFTWHLLNWRTLHYGTAHVTQCHLRSYVYNPDANWCVQYVWNIPNPYWDSFGPLAAGGGTYVCWF